MFRIALVGGPLLAYLPAVLSLDGHSEGELSWLHRKTFVMSELNILLIFKYMDFIIFFSVWF